MIIHNSSHVATSPNKRYYEFNLRKRQKEKNELAGYALSAVFINHAVSMLDVLLSKWNDNLGVSTDMSYDSNNKYGINKINFSVNW